MVKLATLSALVNFVNFENAKRKFVAISKEEVILYVNCASIASVNIPDALTHFKDNNNFNQLVEWRATDKLVDWSGFLEPVVKNEEINGSTIKCRANFDGNTVTIYEETFGAHFAVIKNQITTYLQTAISDLEVF